MLTNRDIEALKKFTSKYPTWWYKIGVCNISYDFDCAPQESSPEIEYILNGIWQDNAFSCDHPDSVADAIEFVMRDIESNINLANE